MQTRLTIPDVLKSSIKELELMGDSLAAQCLGLSAFTPGTWIQSLVAKLRPCGPIKKKKRNVAKGVREIH